MSPGSTEPTPCFSASAFNRFSEMAETRSNEWSIAYRGALFGEILSLVCEPLPAITAFIACRSSGVSFASQAARSSALPCSSVLFSRPQ
jgi:hypothetical protein